ncbi:MAG: GIY-YIG nuclease family protein [Saprospiraceae bacterium]|nr:GIY-YIG nuclease family protein [Bacteroidia bacterium]NNE15577.1 GIY-YIG nuclease family protein [Saprospiraceae bacterium]NNL90861.1 GIY-YIG nuclease family protein [Saprospiraceae bacterium]
MSRKYAVVDLETTGGIPKRDKITEVAIIIYDGNEIVDEFQSLVNPERSIPSEITRITGITNEMVEDSPKFYEIAKPIIEILEGCIFVAHNVRFDYNFLKEEFKSLGYTFTKRNLCTVRLSRKAFPNLRSYSLGNLIKYFGIEVNNRHRAYDDAWATTILLEKIFNEQTTQKDVQALVTQSIKLTKLPHGLKEDAVLKLPEECGVYYFRNLEDRVIYVGKSINIQNRAKQHFSKHTRKTDKLFNQVASISYELTGSELISLLLESYEIKKLHPEINKAQKTRTYKYAVIKDVDKSGYFKYKIVTASKTEEPLSLYGSRKSALGHIENIGETFNLCLKVNEIDKSKHACFRYYLQKCQGACIGEEPPVYYNERFEESLLHVNKIFDQNFVILDEGRERDEKSVILIEDGHYKGYGYIDSSSVQYGIEELKETIKYETINPEADVIVRNYMWSHPKLKVHYF